MTESLSPQIRRVGARILLRCSEESRVLRYLAPAEGEQYHAAVVLYHSPTTANLHGTGLGEIALLDHHFRFLREPIWVSEILPEER